MKISYNWLKDFINIDLDYNEIARILTETGLEVEGIEKFEAVKGGLKGLVIGEVKFCEKHPNADKLSVTKVDIGDGKLLDIVCGAPNVAEGQKVVVATVGTILYDGDKEFKIKKSKIRGALSEGMICAEDEIGLGNDHSGIMVLDPDAPVGKPASEYFNIEKDIIFEIAITPNRIDGASHYGVARDLYAYLKNTPEYAEKVKLSRPGVDEFKIDNTDNTIPVEVQNTEACPRYAGITISGIKVEESPDWLKNRLLAIGQRPINNIVDITNYLLHETGQPLHAFDVDKIRGRKIVVRTLEQGTPFVTLDEQERKLFNTDLMICDTQGGMCIAGVFGGNESGVTTNTKSVFIESAYFSPAYIRRTSKKHQLQTDASYRFERGVDPDNIIYVLKRAAIMIKQIAGGKISSEIIDVYPKPIEKAKIRLEYNYVDKLIGEKIDRELIKNILKSLDFIIENQDDAGLNLLAPTYRVDVTRPADVVEEILRIYGFNRVQIPDKVSSVLAYSHGVDKYKLRNIISDFLSSNGFNEMMANSLSKSTYYEKLKTFDPQNLVRLVNPLSNDMNVMRQTMLFGALEAVELNEKRNIKMIKYYEFGKTYTYKLKNKKPVDENMKDYAEENHLSIVIAGYKYPENWRSKLKLSDFYHLKSYIDAVLWRLGYNVDNLDITDNNDDIFDYALTYSIGNKTLVNFGKVTAGITQDMFEIENEVFYADFNWDNCIENMSLINKYVEPSKFPVVRRDLALLVDKQVRFADIRKIAFDTERKFLKEVNIFDVFENEQKLGKGKKSYAISFVFENKQKTFTDKQIDSIMMRLQKAFEQKADAQIR